MSGIVHFKFKSSTAFDSVRFDGAFVSVAELRGLIAEKKGFGADATAELVLSDPQTQEEYVDDGKLIPKSSSVLVRRVPAQAKPGQRRGGPGPAPAAAQQPEDELGGDLFVEQPEVEGDEHALNRFVNQTGDQWQKEVAAGSRGRGRGRGLGRGRDFGQRPEAPEKAFRGELPVGYVCHRCGKGGHFIAECPTLGDPAFDVKRVRQPHGIPTTLLVKNEEGGLLLPGGETGSMVADTEAFQREVEGLPAHMKAVAVPAEAEVPKALAAEDNQVQPGRLAVRLLGQGSEEPAALEAPQETGPAPPALIGVADVSLPLLPLPKAPEGAVQPPLLAGQPAPLSREEFLRLQEAAKGQRRRRTSSRSRSRSRSSDRPRKSRRRERQSSRRRSRSSSRERRRRRKGYSWGDRDFSSGSGSDSGTPRGRRRRPSPPLKSLPFPSHMAPPVRPQPRFPQPFRPRPSFQSRVHRAAPIGFGPPASRNGADVGSPFERAPKVAASPGLPAGRQQRPLARQQEVMEGNRWIVTDADPAAELDVAAATAPGSKPAAGINHRNSVRTTDTAVLKTPPAEIAEAAMDPLPKTSTVSLEPTAEPQGGVKKHKRKHREEGEGKDKKKRREKEKEVGRELRPEKEQESIPADAEANGRWNSGPAAQPERQTAAEQPAVAAGRKDGPGQEQKHQQERDRLQQDAVWEEVVSAHPQVAAELAAVVKESLPAGNSGKSAKAKKDKKDKKEKGHKQKKHKSKHRHASKEAV